MDFGLKLIKIDTDKLLHPRQWGYGGRGSCCCGYLAWIMFQMAICGIRFSDAERANRGILHATLRAGSDLSVRAFVGLSGSDLWSRAVCVIA